MRQHDDQRNTKELLDMEIFTQKEAREYIKSQLKIGDTYYYQCVLPEIRNKFIPLAKNYLRSKAAMLRIRKDDLDDYIIQHKRRLFR